MYFVSVARVSLHLQGWAGVADATSGAQVSEMAASIAAATFPQKNFLSTERLPKASVQNRGRLVLR